MTRPVYIIDAIRTPRGRGNPKGALAGVKPVELVAGVLRALEERNRLDTSRVDDFILGCVTQTGEQGANLAKTAVMMAEWSDVVPGATVNRFCASGLEAVATAAAKIAAGSADLMVAGGVESMSRVPMFSDAGPWFADPEVAAKTGYVHMSTAADLLATLEGLSREELETLALSSHRRAGDAEPPESLIPVCDGDGNVILDREENVRSGLTPEKLAGLPVLGELGKGHDAVAAKRFPDVAEVHHVHSVATSPAIADGASAVLLASENVAKALGLAAKARWLASASAAVDPVLMLTGNVPASKKALGHCQLGTGDIALFEVNESFAAVPIHYRRHMEIDAERLNPRGGAIALGHPLGATGGILIANLVDNLKSGERGLASICGGAGVASAVVIEAA
jgi:acetyl-CoA C-acetyltransferase